MWCEASSRSWPSCRAAWARSASISPVGPYAYRSSKAGLNAVVKGLAVDLAPRGICCLALHPGWAKTEPGARVEVDASVAGMRGVIHRAGRHHTGSFLTYADQ